MQNDKFMKKIENVNAINKAIDQDGSLESDITPQKETRKISE
jgi:hypothetical protein